MKPKNDHNENYMSRFLIHSLALRSLFEGMVLLSEVDVFVQADPERSNLKLSLATLFHFLHICLELALNKTSTELLLLNKELHRSQRGVESCFWLLPAQAKLHP